MGMQQATTRLEAWKTARSTRIVRDIAAYGVYAIRRFYRDQGMQAAGALTYTTLLALVPLLAIAFAIFSAFPAFEAMQGKIETLLFENLVPGVGQDVRGYVASFTSNTTKLTAVGVVALGVSAVLLLATIESTFNRIWRVERERPAMARLLIFWTVLTLGPLLLGASFSLTTDIMGSLEHLISEGATYVPIDIDARSWNLDRVLAAAIQTVAFTALFVIVPARPVALRDAFIGGAIAGVAFEVLKWGFRLYLTSFPTYQTIYGAMAVIPIFLIWLYLSWTVILFGAVFAASFPEWWRSRDPSLALALTPARRMEAAMALLAVLADRARVGGETKPDALNEAVPLEAGDELLETLRETGYVTVTEGGGYTLARDLHVATLVDLARDLGLSLGRDDAAPGGKGVHGVASDLDATGGRLPRLLRELAGVENGLLGVTIGELLAPAQGDDAVVTLSTTVGD
ncbi:MAG: YihY family inner membrane protein [Alphaproteobacteria bacterium]|nr:YihY family inner membrane protein [Alphaproteobacteria bacterium]